MADPGACKRLRRYCLLQAHTAREMLQDGLALALFGKQQAQPGTALPASFPGRAQLVAAQYVALEDVDGADVAELARNAGLPAQIAEAALVAVARLTLNPAP